MPETYGDYSLMTARRAGQIWVPGAAAASTQWAWSPQPGGTSQITWGDPAAWPPQTFEVFRADPASDWVYLLGYGSTDGQWLPQVVTAEWLGDAIGSNMTPLPPPPDGRQRYVRWTVPAAGYSLQANGYMMWQGERIDFMHKQVWFAPKIMSNAYYKTRRVIVQSEVWSDNSGHPGAELFQKVNRDQYIAFGMGMGFKIVDRLAHWNADLRYTWSWG